MELLSACFTVR